MGTINSSQAHFDMAGAGFGTAFLPPQKSLFQYTQALMQMRGVACDLSYAYGNDIAEATLTLRTGEGVAVAAAKISERWENFGDVAKPLIHTVYNYDLYGGTPEQGLMQVAFAQMQEERVVPRRLADALLDTLNGLARTHDLFPKVRPVAFGASRTL